MMQLYYIFILIIAAALVSFISIFIYKRFFLKPKLERMVKKQIKSMLNEVSPKRRGLYKINDITYNNGEKPSPKVDVQFEVLEIGSGGGKSRLKVVEIFTTPSRFQNEFRINDDIRSRADKWLDSTEIYWLDELDEDHLKSSLESIRDSLR